MPLRGLVPVVLALICAAALSAPSRPAPVGPWKPSTPAPSNPAADARRPDRFIGDEPDTGQFLADTVVLVRIGPRVVRVADYVDEFFNSYAEDRPHPDSAGRLEFMNTLINKHVLGLTALAIDRPLGFEDRIVMREQTQRALSSALFARAVLDSVTVTEDEIQKVYAQYSYQQHMRHIVLRTRESAEKVRADLMAKRITWKDAVRRYSIAPDRDRDGDMGWNNRVSLDAVMAESVYGLAPGQTSEVVADNDGYHIMQSIERRPMQPPAYEPMRRAIRNQLRDYKVSLRGERLQNLMAGEIGLAVDSANVAWASSFFTPTMGSAMGAGGPTLEFNTSVPEFAPADTSRVLARHRFGQFSLGQFMSAYLAVQPLVRPNVNDYESMRSQVVAIVLEPWMAELARRRGLDRDPVAVRAIENRREQIMVEHLYQDSVQSRVWVKAEERRAYYKQREASFVSFPKVTYAAFAEATREAADSLAARLKRGERAADILRADSLVGRNAGSIQERSAGDRGTPFYKLLFEELRPGQLSIEGPDSEGGYLVIQLLSFDPGRPLGYEEVESIVDESLQNMKAEAMLNAMLGRLRKRYHIEAHPELLGRVRMVDPTLLQD